jgi:hypothetical protein
MARTAGTNRRRGTRGTSRKRKAAGRAAGARRAGGGKRKIFRILAINPGSTSTKVSVYDNEKPVLEDTIRHSELDLAEFDRIWEQYEFRKHTIADLLREKCIDVGSYVQGQ